LAAEALGAKTPAAAATQEEGDELVEGEEGAEEGNAAATLAKARAAAQKMDDMERELRMKFCATMRALLVTKCQAVFVGITLKNVLNLTVLVLVLQLDVKKGLPKETTEDAYKIVGIFFLTWILMVNMAAIMTRTISRIEQIPDRLAAAYISGINLIPAWGYKDFIAASIMCMDFIGYINKDKPMTYVYYALFVSFVSGTLQLILEMAGARFEEGTYVRGIINTLMACFALGCAFAVNVAVQMVVGPQTFALFSFKMKYAFGMLLFTPEINRNVTNLLLNEDVKGKLPIVLTKGLIFLTGTGNYVCAQAFKGVFDILFKSMIKSDNLYFDGGHMQACCYVTSICVGVTVLVALLPLPQPYITLMALIGGMNTGWSWSDFAVHYLSQIKDPTLWSMWLASMGLIIVAVIIVLMVEVVIIKIENFRKKEDDKED